MTAGITLSSVFLVLALRHVDVENMRTVFSSVRYSRLLGCAAFLAACISLRSVRWRTIAGGSWAEQHPFFRATTLGVFANLIFPARAGEFIRVFMLAKLTHTPLPGAIASALIDRLLDLFVLLLCAAFIYWFSSVGELIGRWLITMFIVAGMLVILIGLYAKSTHFVEAFVSRLFVRWLHRWRVPSELFLTELRSEFCLLIQGWLSFKLLGLVMLILFFDYLAIVMLLQAFQLKLPLAAPLVLWVFLSAGSALPSAPGYVGVYQLSAVWALSFFGVTASSAVVIATILQLSVLAVSLLMAGPGAWRMCRQATSNRADT
jgi:glycosyltransferase 2 family protein